MAVRVVWDGSSEHYRDNIALFGVEMVMSILALEY